MYKLFLRHFPLYVAIFVWATYAFFLLDMLFAPTARDGAMFFDFCRCGCRCRHFYLYQSQIFIVFVMYCSFRFCLIFYQQKGKERGLWLLPLPLMLLMSLPSIYLRAWTNLSERIQRCRCIWNPFASNAFSLHRSSWTKDERKSNTEIEIERQCGMGTMSNQQDGHLFSTMDTESCAMTTNIDYIWYLIYFKMEWA